MQSSSFSSNEAPLPLEMPAVIIENIHPAVEDGRYPLKWIAGKILQVEADIFKDGSDVLGAALCYRKWDVQEWQKVPMCLIENDRWQGTFTPQDNGRYFYTVEAWVDQTVNWIKNVEQKCAVSFDAIIDLSGGLELLKKMKGGLGSSDAEILHGYILSLERAKDASDVLKTVKDPSFRALCEKYPLCAPLTRYEKEFEVVADRARAEYGAWYEFRSLSHEKGINEASVFRNCFEQLPKIKAMGFDVVCLGPVHPEVSVMADFEKLSEAVRYYDMELAMGFSAACPAGHPYIQGHPEWLKKDGDESALSCGKRDGVYLLNLNCKNKEALWNELKRVVLFWIEKGVNIFRVDEPHNEPLGFWKWLIEGIQKNHPQAIFLSATYTRPKMMKFLAKEGFSQSYTYFPWRNTQGELQDYFEELTQSEMRYYFRGNILINPPEISQEFLQKGGSPAYKIRHVLAATLSASYGISGGFEQGAPAAKAASPADAEKPEKKDIESVRSEKVENIEEYIARINHIRSENPALQKNKNLEFFHSTNEHILCYGKHKMDPLNIIIVVVNLDPFRVQEDRIHLPLWKWGLQEWETYQVKDLLSGEKFYWKGPSQFVRLDPQKDPAHIFTLSK